MGLYSSVLPLLKQFVLTFEMKEPMIHELHEQLVSANAKNNVPYIQQKNTKKYEAQHGLQH